MKGSRRKALLLVAIGNSIFGFSFLFSRLALNLTIPSVLLAVRFTVAFIVLNLIVLIGRIFTKSGYDNDGNRVLKPLIDFSLKGKPLKYVLLLAIFQPCIYFICEGYGMLLTSTAFTGVIVAMVPILGIIFDIIIMHSKVTKKQVVCAAVSVIGVVITSIGGEIRVSMVGLIFLLIAVSAAGLFYVFSKKSGMHFNALEQTYVMFGFGSITYIVIAAIQCFGQYDKLVFDAISYDIFWIAVLFLSIMSSVLAFMLINYGTRIVSISESSLLCNLTTVISIIAGVTVLGETFTVYQIAGAVLILASVYFVSAEKNNG